MKFSRSHLFRYALPVIFSTFTSTQSMAQVERWTETTTDGTFNFFDASQWDNGSVPSNGDDVEIRIFREFDFAAAIPDGNADNVYSAITPHRINFNPGNSNYRQYNTFNYESHSPTTNMFVQQSGNIKISDQFNIYGGQRPTLLTSQSNTPYFFGGGSVYRMEGGTLDISDTFEHNIGGNQYNRYGLNAQFQLAGGQVLGSLTVGEQGNGSYIQSGGVFSGKIMTAYQHLSHHAEPLPASARVKPSIALLGGQLDLEYLNIGNENGGTPERIQGGELFVSGGELTVSNALQVTTSQYGDSNSTATFTGESAVNQHLSVNLSGSLLINSSGTLKSEVFQSGNSQLRFFRVENEGNYSISGGTLEGMFIDNDEYMHQTGGIVEAKSIFTPTNNLPPTWKGGVLTNNSLYQLEGGLLSARIFEAQQGLVLQQGGTANIDNLLNIGAEGPSFYVVDDGVTIVGLTPKTDYTTDFIGTHVHSGSTVAVNGGQFATSALEVASGAKLVQTGGGVSSGGTNNAGTIDQQDGQASFTGSINNLSNASWSLTGMDAMVSGDILNLGEITVTNSSLLAQSVNNKGNVNISTNSIAVIQETYIQSDANAKTIVDAYLAADSLTFHAGELSGNGMVVGDVSMLNGSHIRPGSSPGVLEIYGDFLLGSGATYDIEVGGYGFSEYDQLVIDGLATIESGAIFNLSFSDDFVVQENDYWEFLIADSIIGSIANIDFNILTPWNWSYELDFDNGSFGFLVTAPKQTPVPAPASFLLILLGTIFVFARKRQRELLAKQS